jgi:BMFP domain-containing protein YqiC
MSPVLDGVRIGPIDPDRGENFGQVGGSATARQLIRHHVALTPPALAAALRRKRQDERSDAIDLDEAESYIRGFYEDAGEPIPEESEITGMCVRGIEEQPKLQVLTFTFTTKGGRSAKGFVPYRVDALSRSFAAGTEAVRIKKLKDAGLPWAPSEAALAAAGITGTGVPPSDSDPQDAEQAREELEDDRDDLAERVAELEAQLQAAQAVAGDVEAEPEEDPVEQENEILRARVAELEAQVASAPAAAEPVVETPAEAEPVAEAPEVGEPDTPAGASIEETPAGPDTSETLGAALGLTTSYDEAKAQDVRAKLRELKNPALAQRVLDYETRGDAGQNRSTVTGAANELLDHAPPTV